MYFPQCIASNGLFCTGGHVGCVMKIHLKINRTHPNPQGPLNVSSHDHRFLKHTLNKDSTTCTYLLTVEEYYQIWYNWFLAFTWFHIYKDHLWKKLHDQTSKD